MKLIIIILTVVMAPFCLQAQMSQEEIAKATQNPLTAMYSIPIQNNTYFSAGVKDQTKNIANFQPVIPVDWSENWTMVTRTIIPVTYLPSGMTLPNDGSKFGIGDTTFTAFFTPKHTKKGSWLWGAGPVFYIPTATYESMGTKKWGVGPAGVALQINGRWVYGALLMNVWSFAGSGNNKLNLMTFQPFVNYNLNDGWYIASVPIITSNWEEDAKHRWTVPLGVGIGKAMKFWKIPGTAQLHAYYNVVTPDDYGETWQLRIQIQLLFPR